MQTLEFARQLDQTPLKDLRHAATDYKTRIHVKDFSVIEEYDPDITRAIGYASEFLSANSGLIDSAITKARQRDFRAAAAVATFMQEFIGEQLGVPRQEFSDFHAESLRQFWDMADLTVPGKDVLVLENAGDQSLKGPDYDHIDENYDRDDASLLKQAISQQSIHNTLDPLSHAAMATSLAEGMWYGVLAYRTGRPLQFETSWHGRAAQQAYLEAEAAKMTVQMLDKNISVSFDQNELWNSIELKDAAPSKLIAAKDSAARIAFQKGIVLHMDGEPEGNKPAEPSIKLPWGIQKRIDEISSQPIGNSDSSHSPIVIAVTHDAQLTYAQHLLKLDMQKMLAGGKVVTNGATCIRLPGDLQNDPGYRT